MALSLKTHEYTMRQGVPHLVRTNPYVRLANKEGVTVFIQGGAFWYENGEAVSPELLNEPWLRDSIAALSAVAREEAGLAEAPTKKRSG